MGIKLRNSKKLLIHLKIIVSSLDVNLRDIMIDTHGASAKLLWTLEIQLEWKGKCHLIIMKSILTFVNQSLRSITYQKSRFKRKVSNKQYIDMVHSSLLAVHLTFPEVIHIINVFIYR